VSPAPDHHGHPHQAAGAELGHCYNCGARLHWRTHEDRQQPTCPDCGHVQYLDPKVAVAVVIGDQRRGGIALGLRGINPGKGRWSFPSGYVNRGEVLEEAAAREVQEEFGVRVSVDQLVGVYSQPGEAVVLVVYAGRVLQGEPTPDDQEVLEVRWFSPDALPEMAFGHDDRIIADWRRLNRAAPAD
jgi:8-oxo-dGTP diphosphatase